MKEQKITKGTIIRTACLVVTILNLLLKAFGKDVLPIDDAMINDLVSQGALIIASLVAWWKNNDFTHSARQATAFMKDLKGADKEAK